MCVDVDMMVVYERLWTGLFALKSIPSETLLAGWFFCLAAFALLFQWSCGNLEGFLCWDFVLGFAFARLFVKTCVTLVFLVFDEN